MSTLGWITAAGIAMSALALTGSATLLLPEASFDRVVPVLVALAAGTLTGGAMLHMVPAAVGTMGNDLPVYVAFLGGFLAFYVLEQFLHWHHCHRAVSQHEPIGYLILAADGVHNFVGGMAVGSAFLVDLRVGLVTWAVAAAHEVPQELGDFGILVHAGWKPRRALLFNFLSALTFLFGAWAVYALAGAVTVTWLLPFAAGNFVYIATVDLLPDLTRERSGRRKLVLTSAFVGGLAILFAAALIA